MRYLEALTRALLVLTTLSTPCVAEEEKKPEKTEEQKPAEAKKDNSGALGTFEGEATKGKTTTTPAPAAQEVKAASDDEPSFFIQLLEVSAVVALFGGIQSWERIQPPATPVDGTPPVRSRGEPLIPFLRLDVTYQDVKSDVQAVDGRAETGYGPLGVQARWTHYTEDVPQTDLDFTQIHGLYRMSFGRYGEIDLGMGAGILGGDEKHSGFSLALPMTVQPIPQLGFAFRPSWTSIENNSITDYDVHLSAGLPYVTVETGYRWLSAGGASLDGPFLGGAIHL